MPRKCSVYGCNGNYASGPKVKAYHPNDKTTQHLWAAALPNRNFKWTKCTSVCELHWPSNTAMKTRVGFGGRIPADPPSIFKKIPPSCTPRQRPPQRHYRSFTERNAIPDEIDRFTEDDTLELSTCSNKIMERNGDVVCYKTTDELCIHAHEHCGPMPLYAVYVNMLSRKCVCYSEFTKVNIPFLKNNTINSTYSEMAAILDHLKQYKQDNAKVESITLLSSERNTLMPHSVLLVVTLACRLWISCLYSMAICRLRLRKF